MKMFDWSWVGQLDAWHLALAPAFLLCFFSAVVVRTDGNSFTGSFIQNISDPAVKALPASEFKMQSFLPVDIVKSVPTDCTKVDCLALTFDDGPNPFTTPQILDELSQAHVSATFFVIGSRISGNEALLQRMQNEGHEIGNHSWSHGDISKSTPDQIKQEVNQTQTAVESAGAPAPIVFRPPYGTVNQTIQDNVPMSLLLWNEDPQDWAANTSEQVVQAVENSAHPGAIIDLHDIYHVTANALPKVITYLQGKGYHFVTVSQLYNLNSDSRGVYYGHP
jgi:peptidoglycan/xylan/chitin deacetylase (PgdA/CDA1 family)